MAARQTRSDCIMEAGCDQASVNRRPFVNRLRHCVDRSIFMNNRLHDIMNDRTMENDGLNFRWPPVAPGAMMSDSAVGQISLIFAKCSSQLRLVSLHKKSPEQIKLMATKPFANRLDRQVESFCDCCRYRRTVHRSA